MHLLGNQVVQRRIATMVFMLDLTNTKFCTANANPNPIFGKEPFAGKRQIFPEASYQALLSVANLPDREVL